MLPAMIMNGTLDLLLLWTLFVGLFCFMLGRQFPSKKYFTRKKKIVTWVTDESKA